MVNLTDIPINKERVNFRIFGSNNGSSYYGISNTSKKTADQTLYFTEFKTGVSIEKPIYKSWDLIAGLTYNNYKENNSKNNRSHAEFRQLS